VLGFEIGLFYSFSFLLSGSVWVPIAYHVLNNITSSFLPSQLHQQQSPWSIVDPIIAVPCM
jgi:membrane protease YdiL (CAAX protease family)